MTPRYKVIDSHVHLCPLSNIDYLEIDLGHVLYRNHRLEEYLRYNTYDCFDKQGIIVIEMNVKSSFEEEGWENPLREFDYHASLIDRGTHSIDGFEDIDGGLFIKGVIPWAPIPLGGSQVSKYVELLKSRSSNKAFQKIKGFRYVLQDKPSKTLLDPNFIESLLFLDSKNYVFDLGVDLQDGGLYQFEESFQVMSRFPKMKFIINHLSKPDFYLNKPNEEFNEWEYYMTKISKIGNSYVKLSGCFEELPPGFVQEHGTKDVVKKLNQWFGLLLRLYGPKRIIFGSNWPMDNTNGDEYDPDGFNKWGLVVEALLDEFNIDDDAKRDILYNNCIELYNLT